MRTWIIAPLGLALLTAACGETTNQRAGTGAAGGALAGAVVGGPIGALVGAGIGGAGGWFRPEVDQRVGQATNEIAQGVQQAKAEEPPQAAARTEVQPQARAAVRQDDLTNDEVREAQVALSEMGLYRGEIDGMYGRQTIEAVGEFQQKNDLPQTRALDGRTQERIQMAANEPQQQGAQQQPQQQEAPAAQQGAPEGAPAGQAAPPTQQSEMPQEQQEEELPKQSE